MTLGHWLPKRYDDVSQQKKHAILCHGAETLQEGTIIMETAGLDFQGVLNNNLRYMAAIAIP